MLRVSSCGRSECFLWWRPVCMCRVFKTTHENKEHSQLCFHLFRLSSRWAWGRGLKSLAHQIWLTERQATPESSPPTPRLYSTWSCSSWSEIRRLKVNEFAFATTCFHRVLPPTAIQPLLLLFLQSSTVTIFKHLLLLCFHPVTINNDARKWTQTTFWFVVSRCYIFI